METAVKRCPICGSSGPNIYGHVSDWVNGNTGSWTFRKCKSEVCDALWLDPKPDPDLMARYYDSYHTHLEKPIQRFRLLDKLWPNPYSAWQTRTRAKELFTALPPGRVLEVGCGSGDHLLEFQKRGWDVYGQDVDPVCSTIAAKKLNRNIETRDLALAGLEPGSFDLIFTHHVLEHLDDVNQTLSMCKTLLKDGGRMVSFTPNAESLSRRTFKQNWRGLEAPRHKVLLGPRSALIAFGQAGFQNVQVSSFGTGAGAIAAASLSQSSHWSATIDNKVSRVGVITLAQLIEDIWGIFYPLGRWELCIVCEA